MTGLRFDFGNREMLKPLKKLQNNGLQKTIIQNHQQILKKIFVKSQTITQMNDRKLSALQYGITIDINLIKEVKRQQLAKKQYNTILTEESQYKYKTSRKINKLLKFHKSCFYMKVLTKQRQKQIQNKINENIPGAKNQNSQFWRKVIAKKIYKTSINYLFPCLDQLKQVFSKYKKIQTNSSDRNSDCF